MTTTSGNFAADAVTALCRGRHGNFMYLRGDRYVGRSLALYGEYCEGEVDLFRQLVRPGAALVEVGANIGALTVPLARLAGPGGRVLAVEPQRAVYNVLCANLALNGLLNVDPIRAAAGKSAGRADIAVLGYDRKTNFGGLALGKGMEAPSEQVAMIAIDDLGLTRLDLLKVDVEGFETEVIEGARATLERLRPALFVENDRRDHSSRLIETIQAAGYRLWWHLSPLYRPDNFNANPGNVMGRAVSINMLALPRERDTQVRSMRPVEGPNDWWRPGP